MAVVMRAERDRDGQRAGSVPGPARPRRLLRMDCRDVSNAHRFLDVLVNRDRVVLVGPPGPPAAFTAAGAGQLATALRDAAVQARK
jgi:hypothetical protein